MLIKCYITIIVDNTDTQEDQNLMSTKGNLDKYKK